MWTKTRNNTPAFNAHEMEGILQESTASGQLTLKGSILSTEACMFISDCLATSNNVMFESVNIDQCNVTLQGFEALVKCATDFKNLSKFSAAENDLPKEAGFCIAKLLSARGKLTSLNLMSNKLGDIGVAAISGSFASDISDIESTSSISLMTLMELNLSNNAIGDMGVLALCRGLTQYSRHAALGGRMFALLALRMDDNNISDKGALCLAKVLSSNQPSREVLFGTPFTGSSRDGFGSNSIIHLELLSLRGNPIGLQGISALLAGTISQDNEERFQFKSIDFSNCNISLPVLECAITNLKSKDSELQYIGLEIPVGAAESMLRNIAVNKEHSWVSYFRKLSEAVVGCARPNIIINLGSLPSSILRYCRGIKEVDRNVFYDTLGALDAMCVISNVLQLSTEFVKEARELWNDNDPSSILLGRISYPQISKSLDTPFKEVDTKSIIMSSKSIPSPLDSIASQEFEYSKLRREHSMAFQTLASEIHRLVTVSEPANVISAQESSSQRRDIDILSASNRSSSRLSELIQTAVSTGVAMARQQWEMKELQAKQDDDELRQLRSTIELLTERLQALEAKQIANDAHAKTVQLEQRIVKLEAALLAATFKEQDLSVQHHQHQSFKPDSESELRNRLALLELAVEQEHESSLQVLDALLIQQRQFKLMQPVSSNGSSHVDTLDKYDAQFSTESKATNASVLKRQSMNTSRRSSIGGANKEAGLIKRK